MVTPVIPPLPEGYKPVVPEPPTGFSLTPQNNLPEPPAGFKTAELPPPPVGFKPQRDPTSITTNDTPTLWEQLKAGFQDLSGTQKVYMAAEGLDEKRRVGKTKVVMKGGQPVVEADEYTPEEKKGQLATASKAISEGAMERKEAATTPMSNETMSMLKAKTFDDAWTELKKSPVKIITELGARSGAASLPSLVAGTAGGAALGPAGFALGAGVGSNQIEYVSSIVEGLEEAGVDISNAEAVQKAFADQKLIDGIKDKASKRALIIGGADAVTGGIASKTLAPAMVKSALAKEAISLPAQSAIQMSGGAGGEALAQQVTEGGITSPGEVVAEAAGELVTAPIEIAGATLSREAQDGVAKQGEVPKGVVDPIVQMIAESTKTIEETQALLDLAANEEVPASDLDWAIDKEAQRHTIRNLAPNVGAKKVGETLLLDQGVNIHALPSGSVGTVGFDTNANEIGWLEGRLNDNAYLETFGANADVKKQEIMDSLAKLYTERKRGQDLKVRAQSVLQQWVKDFAPTMKIALSSNEERKIFGDLRLRGNYGHMLPLGKDAYLIALNPIAFTDDKGVVNEKALIETTAHEFGHALAGHMFTKADSVSRNAVYNAYKKFLIDTTKMSEGKYQDMVRKIMTPATANLQRQEQKTAAREYDIAGPIPVGKGSGKEQLREWAKNPDQMNYFLSFDEWFAQEVSRFMTSDAKASEPIGRFFAKVKAVLERFYQRFKSTWGGSQTFEAWMKNLAANVTMQRIEREANIKEQTVLDDAPAEDVKQAMNGLFASKELDLPRATLKEMNESLDKFGRFVQNGYTLIQIGQKNPQVAGLQNYIATIKQMEGLSTSWKVRASEQLTKWRKLGKDQAQRLARFALDATVESEKLGRKLTPDELAKLNTDSHNKLNPDAQELYKAIETDFLTALQDLYKLLEQQAQVTYAQNPQALQGELAKLRQEFNSMANRNYFPLNRFGDHVVKVVAQGPVNVDGRQLRQGQLISMESFETAKEARARQAEMKKRYPLHSVSYTGFPQKSAILIGMPQRLVDKMLEKGDLELSDNQRQTLREMSYEMSSAQSFKRQLQKRKVVAGYSVDAMRAYASYFQRFANHLARMQYSDQLGGAIKGVYDDVKTIEQQGGEAKPRMDMANFLEEHRNYILNPGNEWDGLKAAGFLSYLAFVPKSIWVNLTQVPFVSYPYLAARKEINPGKAGARDARAIAELAKAMKDIGSQALKNTGLSQDELAMFDELKKTNVLTQSFAMNLAGMAEGGNLERLMPGTFGRMGKVDNMLKSGAYWGAFGFQLAEEYNRRATALAAYRMAKGSGNVDPMAEARRAVETTQLEYSKWNRAKFMRGKKSVIFLFYSYLQGMLHFIGNDPGKWRYLTALALAAGLSGLPGAEDLMDLIDMFMRAGNKIAGRSGKISDVKKDLRELIQEIGLNPELVMDGLGSEYGLGPLHLMELAGVPFPHVDVAGSLSMGSIVPGLGLLTDMQAGSDYVTVEGIKDIIGAVLSIPINMYKALNDPNPDIWKKIEKTVPLAAFKHLSKAIRLGVRGKETQANGASIMDAQGIPVTFDPGDPKELMELVFMGMGFPSSRLSNSYQFSSTVNEHIAFYEARRRALTAQYDMALSTGDVEALTDVRKAIEHYNSSVPDPRLKLGTKSLGDSLRMRGRTRSRIESGLPRDRRNTNLQRDIAESYDLQE